MKFFTLFDKPSPIGTACYTPSLAVQSEKNQTDINLIIAKYKKTGVLDSVVRSEPLYPDCEAAIADLEKANALVAETEDAFWSLPSAVRDVIGEPSNMPRWISENRDAAEKFGFVAPAPVAPAPSAESSVTPSAPATADAVSTIPNT